MRKSRMVLSIVLSIIAFLVIGFLVLVNIPVFTITDYAIVGDGTYSISRLVSSRLYDSYLSFGTAGLERKLDGICYIEKARLSFAGNRLVADCSFVDDGIVIKSDERAFFYDGESIYSVDSRDASGLGKRFLIIEVDDGYLSYMERYGFGSEFVWVLDSMMDFKGHRTLITRAEFSNNVGSGFLNLYMEDINSILLVEDLSKLSFLGDCIDIISNEVQEERFDTIFSKRTFRLKSDGLFRIKR